MAFRFVGGQLDGASFEHDQVNRIARLHSLSTESGNRLFVLVPPLTQCQQILAGALTKEDAEGPLVPYERTPLPGGQFEFRLAIEAFAEALRTRDQPLTAEQLARKRVYAENADEFINRLRATTLSGSSEVNVFKIFVDEQGNEYRGEAISLVPLITAQFEDRSVAHQFVAERFLETIIGNVNSIVRHAPSGPQQFPNVPGRTFVISKFEMEID